MEEMEDVKHHLVGCLNPTDFISSGRYADLVKKKINEIKKKIKYLSYGGAGLYYRTIQKGIFDGSTSDFKIRNKLEKQYLKNPDTLLRKLKKLTKIMQKLFM